MANSTIGACALGVLVALIAAPALAQEATPSNDSAPNAEQAAAAAAIAKANAAAAKAAEASANSAENRAFTKKAVAAGWRPEVQHGQMVYCRQQVELGSRFSKKVCGTQSQLEVVLEQQQFERDKLKQRGCGGNCGN
ncbi:MAG TPA: hypothetical protein VGI90_08805 [Steroidobacteraceae bacterium]|jgi:hypothetical protein